MAGGKETPRQKMIGMMYLVLTALLALNVSKSILDAFVAIEENVQRGNLAELYKGDERMKELAELALMAETNPSKAQKAKLLLKKIEEMDKLVAEKIQSIDKIKIKLLQDCGEDVESVGEEFILQEKDNKENPLKPIRMKLENVIAQDKYDEVMYELIGENIKKPNKNGMALWNDFNEYRSKITEIIGATRLTEKDGKIVLDNQYYFKAPKINAFKSQKDLDDKLRKELKNSKLHPDDEDIILDVYKLLTKEEFSDVHDQENVHWIGKTFDHAPIVAGLASLSSLQNDILAARALAIRKIREQVGGNDFSFNRTIALATGPEVVNQGDEFEVGVMVAAYDSDNQPTVTMNGEPVETVKDGQGIISLTGTSGTMELKGTVAVRNKSGQEKKMNWTKTIQVMKPSGSIELPELNVLYRRYKNKVNATASGYPTTKLTSSGNVRLTKSGNGYIAEPTGTSRTAKLFVSGQTADGRTVRLKAVDYRVSNLPGAQVYIGGVENGGRIPSSRNLFVKFPPEIPLKGEFSVIKWSADLGTGRRKTGNGRSLASINDMIRAIPSGKSLYLTVTYNQNGVQRRVSAEFVK